MILKQGLIFPFIGRHRFSTHYGEQHARLSRDQAILIDTSRESKWVATLTSSLSFKTSDSYVSDLNDIYIDNLVYANQWAPFMTRCLQNWKITSYLVRATIISNATEPHYIKKAVSSLV